MCWYVSNVINVFIYIDIPRTTYAGTATFLYVYTWNLRLRVTAMSTWTLQCSPVATCIHPRLATTRTKKQSLLGNGQVHLKASNRRAGLLLHAAFRLWMKTQPFHLEVIILYIFSDVSCVIFARCIREIYRAKLKLLHGKSHGLS